MRNCLPVGRKQIADILEVDLRTVYQWTNRRVLPKPDFPEINSGPAWERDSIIKWAAQSGRLPDNLIGELESLVGQSAAVALMSKRDGRTAVGRA